MEFEDYSLEEMNELVGSPISKKEIRQFQQTDRNDSKEVAKRIVGKKVKLKLNDGVTYDGVAKKIIISKSCITVILDNDSYYEIYDLSEIEVIKWKKLILKKN